MEITNNESEYLRKRIRIFANKVGFAGLPSEFKKTHQAVHGGKAVNKRHEFRRNLQVYLSTDEDNWGVYFDWVTDSMKTVNEIYSD